MGTKEIINLNFKRTIIALIANVVVIIVALISLLAGIIIFQEIGGFYMFMFTILSNMFVLGCDLVHLAFIIEGLVKKIYRIPRWAIILHFSATLCLTVTMVISLTVILPVNGLNAVTGINLYHHVINPLITINYFIFIASERRIKLRHVFISMIPLLLYEVLYFVKVVLIGEANGGWPDFYMIFKFMPWPVAGIGIALVCFGLSCLLMLAHNSVTNKRYKYIRNLEEKICKDLTKEEVILALHSLSMELQKHAHTYEIIIPYDLLKILSKVNNTMTIDEIIDAYTDGALEQIRINKEIEYKKREKRKKFRRN